MAEINFLHQPRWIIGKMALWLLKLHFRSEVIPYARQAGYSREETIQAAGSRAKFLMGEEWPAKEEFQNADH